MSVLRFDLYRDFDRLAEQMLSAGLRGAPRSVPMDAYRRADQFFIHLDLPGVEPDAIELTVEAKRADDPGRAALRTRGG